MLKFRLNKKQILGGLQPLSVADYELKEMPRTDGEESKNLLICYCDTIDGIATGSSLMCLSEIEQSIDGMLSSKVYDFTQFHTVLTTNTTQKSFSILLNKHINLPIQRIYVTESDGAEVAHIVFENSHFFSNIKTERLMDMDAEDEEEKPILHFSYTDDDGFIIEYDIHIDGEKVRIDAYNTIDIIIDKGGQNGDEDFATLIQLIGESIQKTDNSVGTSYIGEVSPSIFSIGREQPMLDKAAGFRYYVEKTTQRIGLSLDNSNQFGLTRDFAIQDIATDYKEKVINNITDAERDIYHPVYKNGKGEFLPIYRIKFNLHFRQHRGDDWLVNSDSFWNGVEVEESEDGKSKTARLMTNIKSSDKDETVNFFSTGNGQEEYQSDLLTYLNFTNSDVKFQKSRLKKSFIRLGFYDSDDVNEQSLLANSTIFTNAGDVFTKQVRHLTTKDYIYIDKDDNNIRTNLVGAKVDREVDKGKLTLADVEDRRLSCQFVVKDRDNSMSSSEGFYLYLMKSMRTGTAPSEVYMRVEFNHAGYGITSPMMMPYVDPKKHGEKERKIKSFSDILKDWNGEGIDGPYGIKQYLKFIHIKFKYCYDKKEERYVYYLDDTVYGYNVVNGEKYGTYDESDGTLTINLYEAKIDTRTDAPEDNEKN